MRITIIWKWLKLTVRNMTHDVITEILHHIFLLVFNLTNKIDVEETERKIVEYKETNKDLINKNRGKLVSEFD
jgi:hypothetical protein